MRAIRIHEHGGPDALHLVEIPIPALKPGHALIRNHAIGVNYVDAQHRQGGFYPVELPLIPGIEAAGVVEQVGEDVTQFAAGDRVAYAGYMGGNYADYTLVAVDQLLPVPDMLALELAAAGLMQAMTAHCLTHEVEPLREGQWVLIHAAAGGVGYLLAQFAKHAGAIVIGTVSSPVKMALAMAAGADYVINHRERNLADAVHEVTRGEGVHVVYDAIGKDTFETSLAVLRACGHLVIYGQTSGGIPAVDLNRLSGLTPGGGRGSLSVTWAALSHYNADRTVRMARAASIFALMAGGQLDIHISHRLPLEAAAEAHRLLDDRARVGKILLMTGA
jgi:NADPH2:quinone reductase